MLLSTPPVMEKAIAQKADSAGSANTPTCSIARPARGSFSESSYTDLPRRSTTPHRPLRQLPFVYRLLPDTGDRRAYQVDARRCISYLTIELKGVIPHAAAAAGQPHLRLRRLPAGLPMEPVCHPNAGTGLHAQKRPRYRQCCANCLPWDEDTFLHAPRVGYPAHRLPRRWLRNIAVALGNATDSADAVESLQARSDTADPLVREHIEWALGATAGTTDQARSTPC